MDTITVKIFFVGLCSFLNMHDKVDLMPPPSVIVHHIENHHPFIGWDINQTTLDNENTFAFNKTANNTHYIEFEGEELSINDDPSGDPQIDTTFDQHIASIGTYGKVGAAPVFDQKHVPLTGQEPDETEVAAYLEFGHGHIISDWQTQYPYIFTEPVHHAQSTASKPYDRRVAYYFDTTNGALVVVARAFDNSSKRKFIFRPKAPGGEVQVWIGNSMDIDYDMNPSPTITEKVASHFKYFYNDLANKKLALYVPVLDGNLPDPVTNAPVGGVGSGFCGPDNQP
jgi:hypothetical protein